MQYNSYEVTPNLVINSHCQVATFSLIANSKTYINGTIRNNAVAFLSSIGSGAILYLNGTINSYRLGSGIGTINNGRVIINGKFLITEVSNDYGKIAIVSTNGALEINGDVEELSGNLPGQQIITLAGGTLTTGECLIKRANTTSASTMVSVTENSTWVNKGSSRWVGGATAYVFNVASGKNLTTKCYSSSFTNMLTYTGSGTVTEKIVGSGQLITDTDVTE
jgi:hypothetical protein